MVVKDWKSARRIGVFGSWRPVGITPESVQWSHDLGALIARQGILVTGGSAGVVLACRQGCREAGGMNLAILPDEHVSDATRETMVVDMAVPTGLGVLGRMPSLTEHCDFAIAIGGGAGTLVEIALTYLQRKTIVVVESLRRRGDPSVSRLLSRRRNSEICNTTVVSGYLDSKPADLVLPVYVLRDVPPEVALNVAMALHKRAKQQPLAASEVADR